MSYSLDCYIIEVNEMLNIELLYLEQSAVAGVTIQVAVNNIL